jgi:HAAS domain-containing protein
VNSTLTGPVATYLAQVKAELSDLPPGELADVLEDVTGHLSEVATEFDEQPTAAALQERLGTPRQYADELRTAAGYPPRTKAAKPERNGAEAALTWGILASLVGPLFLIVGLANGDEATIFFGMMGLILLVGPAYLGVRALQGRDPRIVLDTPRGRQGAEQIRNLIDQIPPNVKHELVTIGQPVWWVARGIVGGGAVFAVSGASAVTVVGALAGAVVSVWIGRKTQKDRRWLWYVVPLNVVATVIVPLWLAYSFVGGSAGPFTNYRSTASSNSYYPPSGLFLDGTSISNVYPFDEQGHQVQVRLYDQDGKPISLPLQNCAANDGNLDANDSVSNVYPQAVVLPDDGQSQTTDPDGNVTTVCKDSAKAPFVPPPAPATTPTAGPTAGATTTPTPKPSTPAAASKPTPTAPPTTGKPGVTLTVTPTR